MIHSQMTGNFVAITTVLSPWGFRLKKLFKNYTKKMDEDMLYKKITLKMMWLLHISIVSHLSRYFCNICAWSVSSHAYFIGFSQTKHCHMTMLRNLFWTFQWGDAFCLVMHAIILITPETGTHRTSLGCGQILLDDRGTCGFLNLRSVYNYYKDVL